MKIAMMTNNYKPFIGGVPISIERLSKELHEQGHEVIVFAPEYENQNEQDDRNNHVLRFKSWKGKINNGAVIPNAFDSKIRKELEKGGYDLIHVHHPMFIGNAAVHYGKKYGIPVVYTYHTKYEEYLHYIDNIKGFENGKVVDFICKIGTKAVPIYMKHFLKGCHGVIAPSLDICRYVQSLEADVPVHILPTGLDKSSYVNNENKSKELREKYLQGRKYLLCTVSRLEIEKNQYYLLHALKELKERIGDTFRFVFVGDGSEREALEVYSEELGIRDNVIFVGAVPNQEVKDYLFASDAFLFSSKSETQGIVILEAMAAGLPVIALDATGVRDIVKEDENGYLIQGDGVKVSTDDYVDKIISLLYDDDRRKAFAGKAKETALCYHSFRIAQMAEDFYKTTIENSVRREQWKKNGITSLWWRMIRKLDKALKYI